MSNIFRQLEDESYFVQFVGNYFSSTPAELGDLLKCTIDVDKNRLSYAHKEYTQGVGRFSLLLQSGDPDHYKRAGALLHSLYLSKPIVKVVFDPELDDADTLCTSIGVNYSDAEQELSFGGFYNTYFNEFTAFALAYDCCRQYEQNPRQFNADYLHTVCAYLSNNGNLSVESLFILFKSLMH